MFKSIMFSNSKNRIGGRCYAVAMLKKSGVFRGKKPDDSPHC